MNSDRTPFIVVVVYYTIKAKSRNEAYIEWIYDFWGVTLHFRLSRNNYLCQVQQPLSTGYLKGPVKLHNQGPQFSQRLPHAHLNIKRNTNKYWLDKYMV